MSELMIDGWACEITSEGHRMARHDDHGGYAMLRTDGRLLLAAYGRHMPPAVLAWLIRPLLHDTWEACSALAQRGVNYDNPHKGP